jgi:REP element-mobilizing transposase RayT
VSHTYTLNLLHVVFSTKNRAPLIRNLDGLIKNLRGIARNKNIDILAAGGTENHVHLLLRIPPTRPVSESVRDLKASRCSTHQAYRTSASISCDVAADAAQAIYGKRTRR